MDGKQLKQFVLKTRRSIVNGKIYGESNQTLSLIVPILAASFPRAKFIWLIRNGLDVVSSIFSRQWYTGHSANHERYEDCPPLEKAWIDGRIMGHLCGDVPFAKWEKMDPFARCCWYWAYVNRVIEKDLKDYCSTGSFRKIKLEELDQELPNLVKWLGLGSGTDLKCGRHNRAHYNLYPWQKWTSEERKTFLYWCGPLMDRLYPDWRILNREYFSFLHDTPKRIKLSIENNIQNQKNVRNINSTKDKLENLSVYFTPQLKTRPKISVYITSYNQKEYLFEAIESVLAQTLKPHQVIIVDDFSNDGSQELIAKYAQKYPNLILPIYHTKNLGVVKTRIDALNAVTGDYVTYVDGDDRFLPEKLERELNILAGNSNAQIAYSNNYYINPDGQRIGVWADETKPPQGYIFKETFARRFPKSNLFRMEVINYQVLKSVGFHDPDITIYEDFDLRIRLTKHFQVAFCDEPLSEIRLHKKGLSSLSANQHLASLELIYHKSRFLLADLNEHDREIAKKGFNDYVNKISQGAAKQLAENIKIKKQYSDKRPYEIISSNSSEDESHRANELGANLIFLISQPRSGSTLFQRLLAGHPEIHSTAEPWIMLHPIYALKEKGIETEYRSDLAMRGLADFLMQVPEGIELYKKALRKFGSTLYNRMIELSGKRFFLDKTPRYYHIISELNSIFPEANFIVLLRNPVAVLSSILKTWFENRVDDLETQSLIDMINGPVCLLDGIKKLKERAIVVDYESLVQSPETVMLRVCTRIGIPYYDNMLNYGKNPKPIGRFGDSVGVFQHSRPVTDNVDKWLKNISSAELVEFADEYLKTLGSDIVAKMGYNYEELKQKLDSQRPSWHNPQTNIESIRFLNKEGESLFAKGDIDAALNNLQKAFNLDPNDAVTNNNLGAIYYHKGKKEIALGYYQKATELMPENINFQKNLADFYYVELEKVEESLAVYIKILETNPNDIETLTALAKICSDLEKFEDAKQFYNRILALDPSNQIAKQRMENLINRNQRLPSVSCNCCEDCQTCLCGQDYLVSAVVSCYNSERFINGCLGDLENQTIADRLEIIIVNSGSRENEEKIIREFQAKYSNIKYIKTSQRETLYQAWNRGIKAASGRYITNANTDDRHKKDALEILARTLENHPEVGLAYADCLITENENETFESNSAKSCYIFPEFSVRQMLARQFFGPQPMWRKSVHEKIGYFNPEYIVAGDYDFFIRLGWKYGGIHIPEFLGLYCKRNNSVERANKEINIKEEYAVKTHYRNIIPIEDIYPSLKNCQGDPLAFAAAYADIGNFFIQIFNDNAAAKRAYQKGLGYQPDSFELLNNLYFLNKFEGNFKESKEIKKQLQANKGFVLNSSIVSNDCVQDPQKPEKTFLMKIQHPIVDESTPVIAGSLEHSIQDGKYLQKNIGKQCQQKALKNFNSALEKLNAGRFDLAADLMNNYRRLINYELFEKFDQRRQKSQDVSIIIVSYNSNDDLINCLRSLEKQTFRNFEVIIVDNGKNEAVRRELEAKSILLIHPPGNLFPAEGRNIGASFARGKIIAFLDDDATVQENYVEEIVQAFNKYEIYGLRGKILGKTDNPNNMVARHYDLGDIPIPATLDTEGNSAYLRDIYMEMRGMDPLLFGGEGLELSYRIARSYGENRTIYFPKTIIFHDFAPTNEKCAEKVHRHDFMKQYRVWKYPNIQRWQSQIDQFALNPHLKESAEKLIVKSSSANKPIVSVIVPLFNAAEFIAETLQSVIDQSYQDWETIIVNDGSTDNSVEIVQKLMRENPERRIHLIEQENQGETAARNRAIGACRGKYVLPLDADDKIHPHMLEKCVRVLEERPHISIVYTDVQEFGDKHRMIPAADYRLATLCKFNYIVSCALFRKEVWENVRGYNPNMKDCYEDWDFWIAAAEKGFVGQRIPEALFYYRKRNNSGYSRSLKRDKKAKAQIILNHQKLFTDRQINWAKCILNGDSVALGLELPLALMPIFSNDRTDPNISLARQNTEYHCAVTLPSSQKLSILFFMYGWLEEGGGTILPRQIARAFARRGHRMTVVYAASQNLPDKPPYYVKETEEAGVRLFGIYNRPEALYDPQHPEREIEDQSVRKIIAKIIGETKPDIVHYHNLHTLSMSVAEEVRQRGIPSVYTSHNYWLLCPRVYLFKQDLTLCDGPSPDGSKCAACIGQQNKQNDYAIRFERGRKLTDWCTDRHLAVSQRLRELFIKNGHKTGRIHVLQQQPETVEDIWRQVGSSRQIASDFLKPIKIGFIGSLLPQKGVHILLASMQSIAASDAECHIFGSGPESYVKFLQKQDNKGAIRFHGRYETKQLPNILKELDIVVVPSIWEDCAPLVVAEALAARCPVIGSRIGGIPDFIEDQINGFLFEPANSKDLLNILTRFINDPGLLGKLRSNIQQPKGFDTYLDELVDHYSDVIMEQKRHLPGVKVNSAMSLTPERTTLMTGNKVETSAQIKDSEMKKSESMPEKTSAYLVKWEGSQFVNHSLALVNRELCIELAGRQDIELSLIPYEPHEFGSEADPVRFGLIEDRLRKPLSGEADFHVRHQWPPNFTPPPEGHWIMIQPWEFGALPKSWVEPMRTLVDELWVPSNHVRDVYIKSGVTPDKVFVVPNGVNHNQFNPEAAKLKLNTDKRFKFLFVGGTIMRKGIDVLLSAYVEAFTAEDDVCLVIKDMGGVILQGTKCLEDN
ncbi:MAG: glycosyltransferase [Desulfobacterales bacterium]